MKFCKKQSTISNINIPRSGAALGRVMLNKLTPPPDFSGFLVIPTPLHRRRALERGFNQAEILAQIIAKQFNLPLNSKVLRRRKNIKHQASLDRAGRLKNIQGCFQIKNPELIRGRKILLIDDVITTGATLNEQAELLKQNGAEKIWALVVAKN
jgi:ComF family protein